MGNFSENLVSQTKHSVMSLSGTQYSGRADSLIQATEKMLVIQLIDSFI